MTHSIAVDFVMQGIRCNAICPGTVHTSFVEDYLVRSFAGQENEVRQQLGRRDKRMRSPTQRSISPLTRLRA